MKYKKLPTVDYGINRPRIRTENIFLLPNAGNQLSDGKTCNWCQAKRGKTGKSAGKREETKAAYLWLTRGWKAWLFWLVASVCTTLFNKSQVSTKVKPKGNPWSLFTAMLRYHIPLLVFFSVVWLLSLFLLICLLHWSL